MDYDPLTGLTPETNNEQVNVPMLPGEDAPVESPPPPKPKPPIPNYNPHRQRRGLSRFATTKAMLEKRKALKKAEVSHLNAKEQDLHKALWSHQMGMKLGINSGYIYSNFDVFKDEYAKKDFDPGAFIKSPKYTEWYQNPANAAVVGKDYTKMSWWERNFQYVKNGDKRGDYIIKLAPIGWDAFLGKATVDQRRDQKIMEEEMAEFDEVDQHLDANIITQALGAMAEAWDQFVDAFPAVAGGGVAGGATGAVLGGATTAGAGALPGAATGALTGMTIAGAVYAGKMELSHSFLEYEKIRDENGTLLPLSTIRGAALLTGIINGGLEIVGIKQIAKAFPKVNSSLKGLTRRGIKKLLKRTAIKSKFGKFLTLLGSTLGEVIQAAGAEGATEFMQEITQDVSGKLAKLTVDDVPEGTNILDYLITAETLEKAKKAGLKGALGGSGLSVVGQALSTPKTIKRVQEQIKAEAAKDALRKVNEDIQESDLKNVPDAVKDAIRQVNGGADGVFLDANELQEFFQKNDLNAEEIMTMIMGESESFQKALFEKGDVKVSMEDFLLHAVSDENMREFFFDEMKLEPDARSARETRELIFEEQRKALVEDAINKSQEDNLKDQIVDIVADIAIKGGMSEQEAVTDAELYAAFFVQKARETGRDPIEILREYNLKIQRRPIAGRNQESFTRDFEVAQREIPLPDRISIISTRSDQQIRSSDSIETITERIQAILNQTPNIENRHTGMTINLSKKKISNFLRKSKTLKQEGIRDQLNTLANLAQILPEAVYLANHKIKQGEKTKDIFTFVSPVNLDGVNKLVRIEVSKDKDGKAQYENHEIVDTDHLGKKRLLDTNDFLTAVEGAKGKTFFQGGKPQRVVPLSPLGFYSHLENEVLKMEFKTIPGEQLKSRIKKIGGLKKEELEMSGLINYIDSISNQDTQYTNPDGGKEGSPKGKVSKEEIQSFLENNGPKIDQVILSKRISTPDRITFEGEDHPVKKRILQYAKMIRQKERRGEELTQEEQDYFDNDLHETPIAEFVQFRDPENMDFNEVRYYLAVEESLWEDFKYNRMDEFDDSGARDEYKTLMNEKNKEIKRENRELDEDEEKAPLLVMPPADSVNYLNYMDLLDEELVDIMWDRFRGDEERAIERGESYYSGTKTLVVDSTTEETLGTLIDFPEREQVIFKTEGGFELDRINLDTNENERQIRIIDALVQENYVRYLTEEEEAFIKEQERIESGEEEVSEEIEKSTPELFRELFPSKSATKWESHIIEGPKEDYHEILLTLPQTKRTFTFPIHFREENFFLHSRATIRKIDGQYVFLNEELQSDWHQQGREKGYVDLKQMAKEEKIKEHIETVKLERELIDELMYSPSVDENIEQFLDEQDSLTFKKAMGLEEQLKALEESKVTDAPFKKTESWTALGLKRLITMAVESGADTFATSPAEVHIQRWGTERILWEKKGDGVWIVNSKEQHGGHAGFIQELEGLTVEEFARQRGDLMEKTTEIKSKDQLRELFEETLDREHMERSLNSITERVWSDMQKGEERGILMPRYEGMKFFYDSVVPKLLKGILNKIDKNIKLEVLKVPLSERRIIERRDTSKFKDITYEEAREVINSYKPDSPFSVRGNQSLIKYLNNSERTGESAHNALFESNKSRRQFALMRFDPNGELPITEQEVTEYQEVLSFKITDKVKKAVEEGFTYYQNKGARGSITFRPGMVDINLFKDANLSTFLHETGHFFLEVFADLANSDTASQSLKDDWAATMEALGVTDRSEIGTEQHESWAEQFERKLETGKAPSERLKGPFARFRSWLVQIYKHIKDNRAQLDPRISEIMDRMLASDEEIRQVYAEQGLNAQSMVEALKKIDPKEAQRLAQVIADAKDEAETELAHKLYKEVKKRENAVVKERSASEEKKIRKEISEEKGYQAMAALTTGTLPDGTKLDKTFKISRKDLVQKLGQDAVKDLSVIRPYVYANQGGIDATTAAGLLGYDGPKDMVDSLLKLEGADEKVARLLDERMKEILGDSLHTGQIEELAQIAVHNHKRDELLALQMELLAKYDFKNFKKLDKSLRKKSATKDLREQADQIISRTTPRNLTPGKYLRAEARNARKFTDAFYKGDIEAAIAYKEAELINAQLYKKAIKAQEEVQKIRRYAKKFDNKQFLAKFGKVDQDLLGQIKNILEYYDFQNTTYKEIDYNKSLKQWIIESAQKDGVFPLLNEQLLNRVDPTNYREVPMEELRGVYDALKALEFQMRTDLQTLVGEEYKLFADEKEAVLQQMKAAHGKGPNLELPAPKETPADDRRNVMEWYKSFVAAHEKASSIFKNLGGGNPLNQVFNTFYGRISKAADDRDILMGRIIQRIQKAVELFSEQEREAWANKEYTVLNEDYKLSHSEMMMVLMNLGNIYNRQALMEGWGWTNDTIDNFLSQVEKRDMDFAQMIWDMYDFYLWPMVKQLEIETTGLAPEKVEADAIKTRFGTYRGGYFPVMYSKKLNWRKFKETQVESLDDLQELYVSRKMTKQDHVKERTINRDEQGNYLKVSLSISGFTESLHNVAHDLTHRKAVIDAHRFLRDKDIRSAILGIAGRETYLELDKWIASVATEKVGYSDSAWEAMLGNLRSGATAVNMGFNIGTTITQPLGVTVSAAEIGEQWVAAGVKEFYKKGFSETAKFIEENSVFMAKRKENYSRDVRDYHRRSNILNFTPPSAMGKMEKVWNEVTRKKIPGTKWNLEELRYAQFDIIGMGDIAVAYPTWMGAYKKAMAGEVTGVAGNGHELAVKYADQVVKDTQGSGRLADLAGIQRGSEWLKLFTMHYSYHSVLFNQFRDKMKASAMGAISNKELYKALFYMVFLSPMLEALVRGRLPEDDDPKDIARWMALNTLSNLGGTVIGLRNISGGLEYGFSPSPAFGIAESATSTASTVLNLVTFNQDEIKRKDIKNMTLMTGYVFKLPARQTWKTLEFFYDWLDGKAEANDPLTFMYKASIKGTDRK